MMVFLICLGTILGFVFGFFVSDNYESWFDKPRSEPPREIPTAPTPKDEIIDMVNGTVEFKGLVFASQTVYNGFFDSKTMTVTRDGVAVSRQETGMLENNDQFMLLLKAHIKETNAMISYDEAKAYNESMQKSVKFVNDILS